jgi:hypothetical protein
MDGPTLFDAHLFLALLGCEFEVRGDDHEMPSCLSLFAVRRNEEKIYRALLKMAYAAGMGSGDDTWAIRVGYTALRKATGCSSRAFGRAWPRLLAWGFLKSIEAHQDRRCARYIVRSVESVDATYKEMGYTYFRVMPDGSLQPFRPKPRVGQGTK